MKMPYVAILLLSAISLINTGGCKKTDQPKYYYIDTVFKNEFSYKAGTYWVFKNITTNSIDSLYVVSYSDVAPSGFYDGHESAGSYMIERNTTDNMNVASWSLLIDTGPALELSIDDLSQNASMDNGFGNILFGGVPIDTSHKDFCRYIGHYSLEGQDYNNVYVIHNYLLNNYDNTYYMNLEQGFIEVDFHCALFPNTTLHLLRYNIVK